MGLMAQVKRVICPVNLGLASVDGLMADSYTSYPSYPKTLGGMSDLAPAYRGSKQTQA